MRLDFEACSGGFRLLGAILDTYGLLHVHGVGPLALHLEDEDLEELLSLQRMLRVDNFPLKHLFLFLLIATLLQILDRLPQPVNLPHAILMVARIVVVPQAILVLRRLHDQQRLVSIRLQLFLFLLLLLFFIFIAHFSIFDFTLRHFYPVFNFDKFIRGSFEEI